MTRSRRLALAVHVAVLAAAAWSPGALAATSELADRARSARDLEDLGGYGRATDLMKALRAAAPPDADLELALAINEARIGQVDSSAARLWGGLLAKALVDTLPYSRRQTYFWDRDKYWINGTWDGWHWCIARARAEVAARRGRWNEAYDAAKVAADARPLSGKEWLVLSVCAGKTRRTEEFVAAAERAALLDPTLPEPHYLLGLNAWRGRRTADAQRAFREAIRRDSSWQAPALALVRSRLPGSMPDSLTGEFLTSIRQAALLTSAAEPKQEHFVQFETPPLLVRKGQPEFPAELKLDGVPPPLLFMVLLDERGRVVANELPWLPVAALPDAWISAVVGSLPRWEFKPGAKLGQNRPAWVSLEYQMPSQ
jgi:hypothetical protein